MHLLRFHLQQVCDKLHSQGKAETVVITSGEIGDNPDQIVRYYLVFITMTTLTHQKLVNTVLANNMIVMAVINM